MEPYPLLFEPILKPKVWGGRALEKLGKKLPPGEMIGESWEVADLPESVTDGRSVIANGELAGMSLHDAIQRHRAMILGEFQAQRAAREAASGDLQDDLFPLLIKYLDARENLSVQVHPTPEYVQAHPETHLKSEAWLIVDAEPGSVIYKGIRKDVSSREFAQHIKDGTVVDDLIKVPVRRGDFHYLPSGTCHALGAGVVVAEIQTPSDTTFRVYDWGRDASRELHIEQALECIHFGPQPDNSSRLHKPIEVRGVRTTPLAATEHFEIDRVDSLSMARFEVVSSGLPEIWMMIAGAGRFESADRPTVDLHPGTTVLVPAALGSEASGWNLSLARSSWLVRVRLPSPLRGMIA
jgi:mannose-6-phosphate isomerase